MRNEDCDEWREVLSASLDGEATADERLALGAHVAGCAGCRAWRDRVEGADRLLRSVVPLPSPGVDERVLAARPGPARARLGVGLRWALGLLGAVQFLLGIAQVDTLVAAGHLHPDEATGGHLWHESAAWNVAVGAGFGWIALRRTRAGSLIPTLTAFVVMLSLLSVNDALLGDVNLDRLLSHGFLLAGYVVVLALSRPAFDFGDPGPRRGGGRPGRSMRLRLGDEDHTPAKRGLRDATARHRRAA